jgi:hypothetical protein
MTLTGITKNDLHEQIDQASRAENEGTNYPDMSYEVGVKDALNWILSDGDMAKPLEIT